MGINLGFFSEKYEKYRLRPLKMLIEVQNVLSI